jgi:Protein of unknown function (DUF3572)
VLKPSLPNASEASSITLNLITFIVSEEERLERFLALSGMSLMDIKNGAANPEFQGFMLDYALQDEKLVVDFSSSCGIKAESLQLARLALPGATHDF